MIKILKSHDLYLTYSWSRINQGICGHTYEVIDYYLLLKDIYKVAILIQEDMTPEIFEAAIRSKYDLSDNIICNILENLIIVDRPKLLKGSNILVTDGRIEHMLIFDNVFLFGCAEDTLLSDDKILKKGYNLLADNRVYPDRKNIINYVKKINFNDMPSIDKFDNKVLLYGTEDSRLITKEMLDDILIKYPDDKFVLVSNYTVHESDRIECLRPPIANFHTKFNKYLYTPTLRHSDCSSRLLAECQSYDKEIEYYNIDYLDNDPGLYNRIDDINNLTRLSLTSDDMIIEIFNYLNKNHL